jgi:acyl carrier protein
MHSHKQAMLQYTGRKDDQVKIREHRIAAVAARDEIDEALIAIWEAILERNNIGIEDNFFDLGGHSLKATRVISKITEQYGIRIDLQFFFQAPTIENLSNYIRSARNMQNTLEVAAGEEDELII